MPHITIHSGIDWHYDIEGNGEHLLFVHGWGVDKRIWRQQSKFFFPVLSRDDHRPSRPRQSGWKKISLDVMVKDLKAILQSFQFNDVSVIGSSFGGLVALKLYELDPAGIKRLIFVGSMPKFSRSADYPHGLDVDKMRKLGGQLDSDYPSIVNVFFRSLFTKRSGKAGVSSGCKNSASLKVCR